VFIVIFDCKKSNKVSAKNLILSTEVAEKKIERIALEITGQLYNETAPLIIIGIIGGGMAIAKKISQQLQQLMDLPIQLISCELNKKDPKVITYSEQVDFTDKNVLLVDDVTNSGRTLLYALKPLLNFYPKRIQTMSLVERMHKNFPVKIDYIGLSIATTLQDHIVVEVENEEVVGAYIM